MQFLLGPQKVLTGLVRRARLPFDWCDESVSATCQSFNVLGVVGIVCERFAEDRHCNVNASVVVHEGVVRPKDLTYFLAGNNLALPLDQNSQNAEGLLPEQDLCRLRFNRLSSDPDKFPGSDIELK